MFPILKKIDEREQTKPFVVEYTITANGWRASGGIKCNHEEDKSFWGMLEMVVKDIIAGNHEGILNESYTSGFSRYRRPVKRDPFTLRWVEMDYQSCKETTNEGVTE